MESITTTTRRRRRRPSISNSSQVEEAHAKQLSRLAKKLSTERERDRERERERDRDLLLGLQQIWQQITGNANDASKSHALLAEKLHFDADKNLNNAKSHHGSDPNDLVDLTNFKTVRTHAYLHQCCLFCFFRQQLETQLLKILKNLDEKETKVAKVRLTDHSGLHSNSFSRILTRIQVIKQLEILHNKPVELEGGVCAPGSLCFSWVLVVFSLSLRPSLILPYRTRRNRANPRRKVPHIDHQTNTFQPQFICV